MKVNFVSTRKKEQKQKQKQKNKFDQVNKVGFVSKFWCPNSGQFAKYRGIFTSPIHQLDPI